MILIEIEEFEATDRVDLQGTTTANTHKQLKTSTLTTHTHHIRIHTEIAVIVSGPSPRGSLSTPTSFAPGKWPDCAV